MTEPRHISECINEWLDAYPRTATPTETEDA